MLEQLSAVRCFQWDPRQARLAICTGGGKVYKESVRKTPCE